MTSLSSSPVNFRFMSKLISLSTIFLFKFPSIAFRLKAGSTVSSFKSKDLKGFLVYCTLSYSQPLPPLIIKSLWALISAGFPPFKMLSRIQSSKCLLLKPPKIGFSFSIKSITASLLLWITLVSPFSIDLKTTIQSWV